MKDRDALLTLQCSSKAVGLCALLGFPSLAISFCHKTRSSSPLGQISCIPWEQRTYEYRHIPFNSDSCDSRVARLLSCRGVTVRLGEQERESGSEPYISGHYGSGIYGSMVFSPRFNSGPNASTWR